MKGKKKRVHRATEERPATLARPRAYIRATYTAATLLSDWGNSRGSQEIPRSHELARNRRETPGGPGRAMHDYIHDHGRVRGRLSERGRLLLLLLLHGLATAARDTIWSAVTSVHTNTTPHETPEKRLAELRDPNRIDRCTILDARPEDWPPPVTRRKFAMLLKNQQQCMRPSKTAGLFFRPEIPKLGLKKIQFFLCVKVKSFNQLSILSFVAVNQESVLQ